MNIFVMYIACAFKNGFSLLEDMKCKFLIAEESFCLLFQVLFQQFKFFLNLYFLVMATSQFIPDIRIGYLYTYWGPLVICLREMLV
jgi:hypothetical protein